MSVLVTILTTSLFIIFVQCEYSNKADSSPSLNDGIAANPNNISDGDGCKKQIQLRSKVGVISSPNYPLPYGDNITCFWKLQAEPGFLIRLSFEDFNLEGGVTDEKVCYCSGPQKNLELWYTPFQTGKFVCAYDFVHIYERYRVNSESDLKQLDESSQKRRSVVLQKVWGTYCGLNPPGVRNTALAGSSLFVYFFSDASKSGRGFLATYKQIKDPGKNSRQSDWEAELDDNKKTFNFYLVVFLSMCFGILLVIGSLCKLMARALEYNDEYGRTRSMCCGTITRDEEDDEDFDRASNDRRLATPPPEYRDVVKTEEDWLRVINQLGSATVEAARRDLATEDVAVTYDLSDPQRPATNGDTSSTNTVTSSNQAPVARAGSVTTVSSRTATPQVVFVATNRGPRIFRSFIRPSHVGVGNVREAICMGENTRR